MIFEDGLVISKANVDRKFLDDVRAAQSETEILAMFISGTAVDTTPVDEPSPEEVKIVKAEAHILARTGDFEFAGENIFMNNIPLPLPPAVLASFIEFTEKNDVEAYNALKMFWLWTSLNPIENSRRDLLNFVRKNEVSITKNGLLVLYRRLVKNTQQDDSCAKFISECFVKVKKWKKGAKNFNVWRNADGTFKLLPKTTRQLEGAENMGGLDSLYKNVDALSKDMYTDKYTKTKKISLGSIYAEDEDKINLDNGQNCGAGLHVGSKSFGFDSFGDVGVVALVNPMKVRSVPKSSTNKMRVSEMFIVGVYDEQKFKNSNDDGLEDYSDVYSNSTLDDLKKAVKNQDFSGFSCKNNNIPLSLQNVEKVTSELRNRIKQL